MPHPTLIIPFALAPAEHARDLLAALRAPSLAQLLSHASAVRRDTFEPYAPLLPHEQWLIGGSQDNSPAIAHALMQQLGMITEPGYWLVLEPTHFHIARDHLVLTDRRQINIDETTSQTLFGAVRPLFEELGYTLRYGTARHWLLRADAWSELRTCTPDAACGHNVDVWLPRGPGERDWRRLHNEVQMLWHTHAINDAREQQGERRINALWLWGGSAGLDGQATQQHGQPAGLRELARCSLGQAAAQMPNDEELLLLDGMIESSLASDWSGWLAAMSRLDDDHTTPLLTQLKQGSIDAINLVLTDSMHANEWRLRRSSMRKFWIRSSLARLAP
jgi:hypothetical protein